MVVIIIVSMNTNVIAAKYTMKIAHLIASIVVVMKFY